MQVAHAEEGLVCPLHRKDMSEVCHKCPLWVHIQGANPNTGAVVDEWKCSLAWLPMLIIENSQQQRATGAAIEDFRNNLVEAIQIASQNLRVPRIEDDHAVQENRSG